MNVHPWLSCLTSRMIQERMAAMSTNKLAHFSIWPPSSTFVYLCRWASNPAHQAAQIWHGLPTSGNNFACPYWIIIDQAELILSGSFYMHMTLMRQVPLEDNINFAKSHSWFAISTRKAMLISRSRGTCLISCVSRDALPSWWILVVISVSGRHRLAPSRSAISYFSDYLQWKDVIHGFGAIAIKRRCSNPIKLVTPYASWRQSDELDT